MDEKTEKSWWQKVGDEAGDIFDAAKEKVKAAEALAAQKLKEAEDFAIQKAKDAEAFAAQKAKDAKAFVEQKAKDAKAFVEEKAKVVEQKAGEAKAAVVGKAKEAEAFVEKEIEAAKEELKSIEDGASKLLKELEDDVGSALGSATNGLPGAARASIGNKNPVPPPQNPFESPKVQVEIDKLAIEQLRGLASAAAGNAFVRYLIAISNVRNELDKAEADAKKNEQLQFEIAVAIAVVVATPLTVGAAAGIAGAALQGKMVSAIQRDAASILTRAGVQVDKAMTITAKLITAAADKSIAGLVGKFSSSDSQKLVGEALKSLSKTVKVFGRTDKFDCGRDFLDSLTSVVDSSKTALDPMIAGASAFDQLLGMYHGLESDTVASCRGEVSKQLANFMDGLADVIVARTRATLGRSSSNDTIVKMDAYGSIHYAHVKMHLPEPSINPFSGGSGTSYTFISWITRDMESIAEQLHPDQINPKLIRGHLPDPGF